MQVGRLEEKALIKKSKFKIRKNFAAYPKGHITLRDHSHRVSFRVLTIQQL